MENLRLVGEHMNTYQKEVLKYRLAINKLIMKNGFREWHPEVAASSDPFNPFNTAFPLLRERGLPFEAWQEMKNILEFPKEEK